MCYTDVSFVLLKTNKFLIILEVSDTEHTVICSGDITQLIPDDTVTQSQTLVTDAKDDNDTRVTINDEIVEDTQTTNEHIKYPPVFGAALVGQDVSVSKTSVDVTEANPTSHDDVPVGPKMTRVEFLRSLKVSDLPTADTLYEVLLRYFYLFLTLFDRSDIQRLFILYLCGFRRQFNIIILMYACRSIIGFRRYTTI